MVVYRNGMEFTSNYSLTISSNNYFFSISRIKITSRSLNSCSKDVRFLIDAAFACTWSLKEELRRIAQKNNDRYRVGKRMADASSICSEGGLVFFFFFFQKGRKKCILWLSYVPLLVNVHCVNERTMDVCFFSSLSSFSFFSFPDWETKRDYTFLRFGIFQFQLRILPRELASA